MADTRLNPFVSPVIPDEETQSPAGTPGPWRDGPFVVIHPYEAKFPAVCVKSGARHDVSFNEYEMPCSEGEPDYVSFTLKLEIPLNAAYYRKWLLIGLLSSLLACLAGCSGMAQMVWDTGFIPRDLTEAVGLSGMGVLIIGLVFGGWWFLRTPLKPYAARKSYIWMTGACPAFLEELPPLAKGIQRPNWRF